MRTGFYQSIYERENPARLIEYYSSIKNAGQADHHRIYKNWQNIVSLKLWTKNALKKLQRVSSV